MGTRHFKTNDVKFSYKARIASDFSLFSSLESALHQAGIWLCVAIHGIHVPPRPDLCVMDGVNVESSGTIAIVESIVDEVTSQSSTTFCFPKGTLCGRDGLRAQHLIDILGGTASAVVDDLLGSITWVVNLFLSGKCHSQLGEYIASAPLTHLVKPGGGLHPIVVGTMWRRLLLRLLVVLLVNRLIESKGNEVRSSILLVDFKNAFNLVNISILLEETKVRCPSIAPWVKLCYARPPRLYYDDTILWSCQGVQQGDPLGPLLFSLTLHPLVQTINQSRKLTRLAWYLDGCTIVGDTLMVAKALDIIRTDGTRFGDWRLTTFIPSNNRWYGLGILFAGDIIRYAFLTTRLQTSDLQAKILLKTGIDSHGSSFQHALDAFNTTCNVDVLVVTTCTSAPLYDENLGKVLLWIH
ncbi:putative reverse transcriptase domain-containing protein [Tanacetum coccineum]